jgi:hypothetical protein
MTLLPEAELRALVRAALARTQPPGGDLPGLLESCRTHASHAQLALATGEDGDGSCLIEPDVSCTHCGYCRSFGH